MAENEIDYDAWAERLAAEDYELPVDARVIEGSPELHRAALQMLLECADTPELKQMILEIADHGGGNTTAGLTD